MKKYKHKKKKGALLLHCDPVCVSSKVVDEDGSYMEGNNPVVSLYHHKLFYGYFCYKGQQILHAACENRP